MREVLLDVGAVLGLVCLGLVLARALLGVTPLVLTSGSMSPTIDTGDLAFAVHRPVSDLRTGDVVSVVDSHHVRVTHRLVEVTDAGLVLQGDANPAPDAAPYDVQHADRVLFSVPKAGLLLARLDHGWGIALSVLLVGGALVAGFGLPARRPHAPGRRRGLAWAVGGAAVALAVGSPVLRTVASWNDTAGMTASAAANTWFTCEGATVAGVPWLYWELDETSGATAADSSGNNRDGTYTGGITRGVGRACGRDTGTAITLNGSTGYVPSRNTQAARPGPNTFTVQIWFRTTTTNGGRLIGFAASRTGASSQYDRHLYMTDNGRIAFGVYPGGFQTLTSTDTYNDGQWHQAVGQVGPAGMKLFLDGDVAATNPAVTTAESYSGWWRVGYDNLSGWPNDPTSDFFGGTVDEAVVFDSARSEDDVRASYRAGR